MDHTTVYSSYIEHICCNAIEYLKNTKIEDGVTNRHAAIIFKNNNNILEISHNQDRCYIQREIVPSLHAEIACIYNYFKQNPKLRFLLHYIVYPQAINKNKICFLKQRIKNLPKLQLLVIRVNKYYQLMKSNPCCNCAKILNFLGNLGIISNVYYSSSIDGIRVIHVSKAKCIACDHISIGFASYTRCCKTLKKPLTFTV